MIVSRRIGAGPTEPAGPGASREAPRARSRILGLRRPALAEPARDAAGVALAAPARADDERILLAIVDAQGEELMPIGRFDEDAAIAVWRDIGLASGLPLVLRRADGLIERPFPQIGRVQLGPTRMRRRHGFGRLRPRFLARRKPGRLPRLPIVHREREIAPGAAEPPSWRG